MLAAIAQALQVREHGRQALPATLQACLHASHRLVVLDTFEHGLAAAPQLADLLAACPGLKRRANPRSAGGTSQSTPSG